MNCFFLKNKVIRVLFLFLFLAACSLPVTALEGVEQFIELGTGYTAAKNTEREYNPFNVTYGIKPSDSPSGALASFQITDKICDVVVTGEYYVPALKWNFEQSGIQLGIKPLYHFQRYFDLYSENDAVFETIFRYCYKKFFELKSLFGGGYKIALIDDVKNRTVQDKTLSERLSFILHFQNGAEFCFETGSHDLYRYPLFLSPDYLLGAAFNFENGFRISTDISVRFRDQFVVAPYIDRYSWNLKLRYTF